MDAGSKMIAAVKYHCAKHGVFEMQLDVSRAFNRPVAVAAQKCPACGAQCPQHRDEVVSVKAARTA